MNPREDFGQKTIEMEKNCRRLVPAHWFRKQPRAGSLPWKYRHRNVSAAEEKGCVYTLLCCYLQKAWDSGEFYHGSLKELCWLQGASPAKPAPLTSTGSGKVHMANLHWFMPFLTVVMLIRKVWWPLERALIQNSGDMIAGRQEMPPFLHVLYTKRKALTFVFEVQVHLGALTYGNRACDIFTVGGFTLISFFSHRHNLLCCSWREAMGVHHKLPWQKTHNSPICLTNHLNYVCLFQLRSPKPCLPLTVQDLPQNLSSGTYPVGGAILRWAFSVWDISFCTHAILHMLIEHFCKCHWIPANILLLSLLSSVVRVNNVHQMKFPKETEVPG